MECKKNPKIGFNLYLEMQRQSKLSIRDRAIMQNSRRLVYPAMGIYAFGTYGAFLYFRSQQPCRVVFISHLTHAVLMHIIVIICRYKDNGKL